VGGVTGVQGVGWVYSGRNVNVQGVGGVYRSPGSGRCVQESREWEECKRPGSRRSVMFREREECAGVQGVWEVKIFSE
jgi:hypothetical protein